MSLKESQVGAVLAVSDMKKAREFYEQKLGLDGQEEQDGVMVRYQCGEGTGFNVYLSPAHAGRSTATLAGWLVDDVEALVDELTAKGVAFERYDDDQMKTNEKGIVEFPGGKVAFFRDPDGNTHSLNQA